MFPGGNRSPPLAASPLSELRGMRRRRPTRYVSGLLSEPASVSSKSDLPGAVLLECVHILPPAGTACLGHSGVLLGLSRCSVGLHYAPFQWE